MAAMLLHCHKLGLGYYLKILATPFGNHLGMLCWGGRCNRNGLSLRDDSCDLATQSKSVVGLFAGGRDHGALRGDGRWLPGVGSKVGKLHWYDLRVLISLSLLLNRVGVVDRFLFDFATDRWRCVFSYHGPSMDGVVPR